MQNVRYGGFSSRSGYVHRGSLKALAVKHVMVVHSEDGLDEIVMRINLVARIEKWRNLRNNKISTGDFGIPSVAV